MVEVDDTLVEEIRGCIATKKNPNNCIDKILKEHGYEEDQKPAILTQIIKKIDVKQEVREK